MLPIIKLMSIQYPAKILLFGEHTVIKGSQALAVPIRQFFGSWVFSTNSTNIKSLQQNLSSFQQYILDLGLGDILDNCIFKEELNKGIYFQSNIPTGYGLGSSGALCAGILDRYKKNTDQISLMETKRILGKLESFFHGSSSGTDPLVSYTNQPLKIGEGVEKVTIPNVNKQGKKVVFLLDTQIKRKAAKYINTFLDKCKDPDYEKLCVRLLVPLVDEATELFLKGNWSPLMVTMHELSFFQIRYFDYMIPNTFRKVWLDGLNSQNYKLKICGAGGGGFLLGFSNDFVKTKILLQDYQLIPVLRYN